MNPEEVIKKKKQYIVLAVLLIIIFAILLSFLKHSEGINYSEIKSGYTLISAKPEITDRSTYYELEKIITQYVLSYATELGSEFINKDEISYEDYYDALTDEYQTELGRTGYIKVANTFLKKFITTTGSEYESYKEMLTNGIISNIYLYQNNMYVCLLKNNYEYTIGYIGIELVPEDNTYSIFYIE